MRSGPITDSNSGSGIVTVQVCIHAFAWASQAFLEMSPGLKSVVVPEGHPDNSPALERREKQSGVASVPKGRLNQWPVMHQLLVLLRLQHQKALLPERACPALNPDSESGLLGGAARENRMNAIQIGHDERFLLD
jgi:hypothetical protein